MQSLRCYSNISLFILRGEGGLLHLPVWIKFLIAVGEYLICFLKSKGIAVKTVCWGILRESEHSPNRENDDEAILRETGNKIRQYSNVEVSIFSPEFIPKSGELPDLVFFMCERPEVLDSLEALESRGVRMVNTPQGVRNTYRYNTVKKLQDFDFYPRTVSLSTSDGNFNGFFPLWLKRVDFHAVSADDVCQARDSSELKIKLSLFKQRGIEQILAQGHIEGDLIKFYGIQDRWFQYFYHKGQDLKSYAFDKTRFAEIVRSGARELDLEIYGGDAIITKSGEIFLIDLNAWPSFALYRDIASQHIADHIMAKIKIPSA